MTWSDSSTQRNGNSILQNRRRPYSPIDGYLVLVVLSIVLLIDPLQVKADWINLTGAETAPNIAEIYVLDDHVKLE